MDLVNVINKEVKGNIFYIILILISLPSLVLAQVDPIKLSIETRTRLDLVPEFKFIQEEANKLGVKVYLFGGTASAFAHYVRWDLEREAGDEKYQPERFDYDFTNIYRGNQDLDIVVDGTAEQAAALQQILKKEYPHFVGSKEAWEVRLLRAEIGDKLPLLDNPDFLNQHTDTNSTGMVAVNSNPGEIVFRDLFDWENPDSRFLNDVAAGRIKFLFSDSHKTTSRFKEGKNPPVFAAIRYLAKLAQYEVDEAEGDLEIIKRIVEGTNWDEVKNNSYVKHKLEEFGKKVLLNAPDSEYAWNLLEETGLRKRLIEMDGNRISSVESLSWWMNKEPLRTNPLGEGNGKTAAEIFKGHINEDGEIVVAHETNSFEAYENITRSSHGAANAFISRDSVSGEAAMLGDGFYTRLGVKGARGTNLTIRFKLNPNASEGKDFIYKDDFIVVKNKAALELIQENLNISMVNFLKLVMSNSISESDKGLKEKLLRKFNRTTFDDLNEAKSFLRDHFFIAKDFPEPFDFSALEEAESFDVILNLVVQDSQNYFRKIIADFLGSNQDQLKEEWIEALIQKGPVDKEIARYVLSKEHWRDHPEWVEALIDKGAVDRVIAEYVLSKDHWRDHPEWVQIIINRGSADKEIARHVLSKEHWKDHPRWAQSLIDKGDADSEIAEYVLSKEYWKGHPEWVQSLIDKGNVDREIAEYVLSKDHWRGHPNLVQSLIDKGSADREIAEYVLSKDHWRGHPNLVQSLIDKGSADREIASYILSQEHLRDHPELVQSLIDKGRADKEIALYALSKKHWSDHPKLVQNLIDKGRADWRIAQYVLSKEYWADHPELVQSLIDKGKVNLQIAEYVLSKAHWGDHPYLVQSLIDKDRFDKQVTYYILSKAHWRDHPNLVQSLIDKGTVDKEVAEYILSQAHWVNHPRLVQALIDKGTTDEKIAQHVLSKDHWGDHPEWVQSLIDKGSVDRKIAEYVLSREHWGDHPEWVQALIDNGNADWEIAKYVLSQEHWKKHSELLDYVNYKSQVRITEVTLESLKNKRSEISYADWKLLNAQKSFQCKEILK